MELRDGKDASGRKPVVGLIRKKKIILVYTWCYF